VPVDLRVLLPGYSDDLAFEMGFIDLDVGPEEARRRCLVTGPTEAALDGPGWSRTIRREIRATGVPLDQERVRRK
jgi:hypothetical protein